jgi:hypothetical protein
MAEEETCLFHRSVITGEDYVKILHNSVVENIAGHFSMPVVRFADGEYAFYGYSLHCNGLYKQAESIDAIRKILPLHLEDMRILARRGKVAPLFFPGNTGTRKRNLLSFFKPSRENPSALDFIKFMNEHKIRLGCDNYIPFYVVYAYLTSAPFAKTVDKRNVCIIGSEYDEDACRKWFDQFSSRPILSFVSIPDSYVATRWPSMKERVLSSVPENTSLCLVGAGVGALLVCVDVAERFSIPAIDAGHVLNMMNGREDKSKGPRLYTIWKGDLGA